MKFIGIDLCRISLRSLPSGFVRSVSKVQLTYKHKLGRYASKVWLLCLHGLVVEPISHWLTCIPDAVTTG